MKELIRLIEEAMGKKAKIEKLRSQPGDVSTTYADIRKAKRMLKYHPKVNMKEGMKQFIEWYKENR